MNQELLTDLKVSKVALVPCDSYEQPAVDAAVAKAVELLGGLEQVLEAPQEESCGSARAQRETAGVDQSGGGCDCSGNLQNALHTAHVTKDSLLILKPNLLAKADPDRACTTHPAVFEAVGRLLQQAGYHHLKYGDSPGNPVIRVEKVAEECGIKAAADKLGIPLGRFESGTEVPFPEGRIADKFVLCDEVLAADGMINICKMKTHQLERITGAVKNTFGCVFGINKSASHAKYATAETFAKMTADLNRLVKPKLHIMDGIVAMEGNGPQSGTPKKMGVILAATDPVALDAMFCHLVYLKPELVPTNVCGQEQGVGSFADVVCLTENGVLTAKETASQFGDKSYDVQRSAEFRGALKPIRFLAPFLEKKPVVHRQRCIGCGICVNACPVEGKAIAVVKPAGAERDGRGIAVYDYRKCIKCYCCQEMCPQEAITVKKSLLARIADRQWSV